MGDPPPCAPRKIAATAVETPLLVPSYSSRGFEIAPILEDTNLHYSDTKLLSAYDICHGLVPKNLIYSADLLFIDSGHYEQIPTKNPGEPYEDSRRGRRKWNIPLYKKTIMSLRTDRCQVIRVTYDKYDEVPNQIEQAAKSAGQFPNTLTDLLLKPARDAKTRKPRPLIDVEAIIANADKLAFADIIGFTEKELGSSYRARVAALLRIRRALDSAGVKKPIHVFGCLDPFAVFAYACAGADIFDGLSWLRFAWVDGSLVYIPSAVATQGRWNDDLGAAARLTYVTNLSELRKLQSAVRSVVRNRGFREVKKPWQSYEASVSDVLSDADVTLEGA